MRLKPRSPSSPTTNSGTPSNWPSPIWPATGSLLRRTTPPGRTFEIYEELEKDGKLTARISEWLPFDDPVESLNTKRAAHPASDPLLHTGMLKGFMDGSLGSKTAALLEPYSDDPKNSGLPQYEPAKLNPMTRERLLAGYQIGFHAIGEKGVKWLSTHSPKPRKRPRKAR